MAMASRKSDAALCRCPALAAVTPCTMRLTATGFAGGRCTVAGPVGPTPLRPPHADSERHSRREESRQGAKTPTGLGRANTKPWRLGALAALRLDPCLIS